LLAQAEKQFGGLDFMTAQGALRQLLRLDPQHIAGKRLLSLVDQRLTQQEKERKAQELARLAQQAVGEQGWDRALALCDEALGLSPENNALVTLRKSVVEGKQTQEKVSLLLAESANARKVGDLTRAQAFAATAQQLDPHNSQVLALSRLLEQRIEEKRLKEELRKEMASASASEHLAAGEYEEAFVLPDKAGTTAPDNAEVLRTKDEPTAALTEEKRESIVRRLEEKAALSTTVAKLRSVSGELAKALQEFPNDPSLLRLRLNLEPRVKQLEDELFVKEVCKNAAELTPEQALERIRTALTRVPGNEQLFGLESALSERVARQAREQLLAQRLGQARQAIDDRLFLEAVKILERCKSDGFSSYEVDGLLDLAKSAASQRISQEFIDRTEQSSAATASIVDAAASSEVLDRTLDLALASSIPVLTPMEIFALLRLPSSATLSELMKQNRDTETPDYVRSRSFPLEFPPDSRGHLKPVNVVMRVNAPDFEPPRIEKKVRVWPNSDCALQTFLLTPKRTGTLRIQFDVLMDDLTVASHMLKTMSQSSDRITQPVEPVVVSVPLSVTVRKRRRWPWVCGATATVLIVLVFLLMQHHSGKSTQPSVTERGSSILPAPGSSQLALPGKNYALLFATDDYDYWPHLNNPLQDAHTIADELRNNYSFADPEPRVVTNPRTKEIIDILHEYAERSYGPNDQLFIFFAGHGFFDEREQEGFLIARESRSQKDDSEHSSYLNFSRLSRIVDSIPVAHIFVVIDACYGGAFDTKVTKWAGQRGVADEYADVAPDKFIRRKLAVKGRLYLTSGQITTVPDGKPGQHSPFARRFIEVLRGYGGHKQLVTATFIAVSVAKLEPEPRFGDFGDSAPGADFLFIPK
jgi:hypothetical protein